MTRQPSRFRLEEVRRLVAKAYEMNLPSLARLFAVSRTYMARVESEILPVQLDGRSGIPRTSALWHSQVNQRAMPNGQLAMCIVPRPRKNAPQGYVLRRLCVCKSDPSMASVCGHCALLKQMAVRGVAGASLVEPLFHDHVRITGPFRVPVI